MMPAVASGISGPKGLPIIAEKVAVLCQGSEATAQWGSQLAQEWMAVHARTPAERLPDALSLLLDLTEAPAFTAEDVETERKVILEEMAEANDVPEDRLHETLVRSYWPDHPLGAPGREAP